MLKALLVGVFCLLGGLFAIPSHAYVFSNFSWPVTGSYPSFNCNGAVRPYTFGFVSSTAQIEVSDITFQAAHWLPTTTLPYLNIHAFSESGNHWYATSSLPVTGDYWENTFTTTTVEFRAGHRPYALVGDWLKFEAWPSVSSSITLAQYNGTGTSYVYQSYYTSCDSGSFVESSYSPPYDLYGAVQYGLNVSNTGALAVTFPDYSDYGFSSTTAQGTDFGYFGNMFRDLFVYLFQPSAYGLTSNLVILRDLIQTKFPFSYYYSFQDSLDAAVAETSSTQFLVVFTSPTTSSAFGQFVPTSTVLFSSSTVTQYVPSAVLSLFKTLIAMTFVFALVVAVWNGALRLLSK